MRLTRAFVDLPLAPGARIVLPDAAAAHLLRVLRLGEGDACVLFNGDGRDYAARIVRADRRGGEADILDAREAGNESPLRIVLLQALARGEKMDWILQKATELGVHAIVPVHSDRSEVKLDADRAARRHAHWRNVVVSACEQSGRARVPALALPAALPDAVRALADAPVRLLLDPDAAPADALPATLEGTVALAIGPEGGWSDRDRDTLAGAGFTGLRLGPRVLRTETAGLAAIAVLQARHGDF